MSFSRQKISTTSLALWCFLYRDESTEIFLSSTGRVMNRAQCWMSRKEGILYPYPSRVIPARPKVNGKGM